MPNRNETSAYLDFYCWKGHSPRRNIYGMPKLVRPHELPAFTYVSDLIPQYGVVPDSEKHEARKKALMPFSKEESDFADREMYDRIKVFYERRMHDPKTDNSRPRVIYKWLSQANEYIAEADGLLQPLGKYYDQIGNLTQPVEKIMSDSAVIDSMGTVFAAEEAGLQGWPEQSEDDKKNRLAEIKSLIAGQDLDNFLLMFDRAAEELEARAVFWEVELATLYSLPALAELDRAIDNYHPADDAELLDEAA